MKTLLCMMAILVVAVSTGTRAEADPYQWCAQYSGLGGARNCGFITIQQCMATIAGMGGFCVPNQFASPSAPQYPEGARRQYYRTPS
jgi:hypothetical protein